MYTYSSVLIASQRQQNAKRFVDLLGHNMMLFDMGAEVHPMMTSTEVRQTIDEMDQLFDIVMIADKMDESLILLKELLCWDFEDIVFFKKNARQQMLKPIMSLSLVEKLRDLNRADAILYDHFRLKHQESVLRYGEIKMAQDVALLATMRQKIFMNCDTKTATSFQYGSIFQEYSKQVNGYTVDNNTSTDCWLLTLPELPLIDKVRNRLRAQLVDDLWWFVTTFSGLKPFKISLIIISYRQLIQKN